MRLADYISKELIFTLKDNTRDKNTLIETLARQVVKHIPTIDESRLAAQLKEREAQASTGIGRSIAIPHTALDGIDNNICVVAQMQEPVDYESIDDAPVYLVFLLLSPSGNLGNQLKLLARIARIASKKEFITRLIQAKGVDEIFSLIEKEDSAHV